MSAEYTPPPAPYRPIGRLPLGVAIIAIIIGIFGFFYLIASILLFFGALGAAFSPYLVVYGGLGFLGALLLFIFAIVLFVVAGGLWNQRLWALALAIIVVLLLLVGSLYGLYRGHGGSLFAAIIEGLILIYLIAVSGHFA